MTVWKWTLDTVPAEVIWGVLYEDGTEDSGKKENVESSLLGFQIMIKVQKTFEKWSVS